MKNLVLQSDFGLEDGAVSAMVGVSLCVNKDLPIYHLTHSIESYNIFEASYRLVQTVSYWPKDTVFVSVVDPGVGSNRKSVVAKLKNGQYIVTPNNGTLTHVSKEIGIVEIREISEVKNRRANTEKSYTFHGRDVYAYTGAKLASGAIEFKEVGRKLPLNSIVKIEDSKPSFSKGVVKGKIDILDIRFGSLWTNIPAKMFEKLGVKYGQRVEVTIYNGNNMAYQNSIVYGKTFADVMIGSPILYVNSLYKMGIAINQGSFAKAYNVGVGNRWKVEIRKTSRK